MSADSGIGGAWGVLLRECNIPGVKDIYDELQAYTADNYEPGTNEPEDLPRINEFTEKVIQVLKDGGIVVPEGVSLLWTGSSDDRPARCDAPPNAWVLGWGVFTAPWQFPTIDESFRKIMWLHSWVWMG